MQLIYYYTSQKLTTIVPCNVCTRYTCESQKNVPVWSPVILQEQVTADAVLQVRRSGKHIATRKLPPAALFRSTSYTYPLTKRPFD
jgi:hypothetical protein